jgi:hypothetical protein
MTHDEEKHILLKIKEDPEHFGVLFDSTYNQIFSAKNLGQSSRSSREGQENFDFKIFNTLEDVMAEGNKSVWLIWISPMLLVGLPLIGVILNFLAITHFYWNKLRKELLITIKYRLANIILLIISAGVASVFVLYVIVENIHHRP